MKKKTSRLDNFFKFDWLLPGKTNSYFFFFAVFLFFVNNQIEHKFIRKLSTYWKKSDEFFFMQ